MLRDFQTSIFLLLAVLCSLAARANSVSDRDIFTNEKQTRRPAQGKEFEMALGLGGCAGVLIAADLGLSAAHCKKTGAIKSGIALRNGLSSDGTIVKTIEIGSTSTFDYWIFEVRWKSGLPSGMRFVPRIQIREDELRIGANDAADKIYTLGFPGDISNGKLIFAWGCRVPPNRRQRSPT